MRVGFVWGVCDCEVGVVRKTDQGGEEGGGGGKAGWSRSMVRARGSVKERYRKGPSAPPWGTPLPGSRKGVRLAPLRTGYLQVRMYLEVKL